MEMIRPMLLKSKIPSPFWAEALATAHTFETAFLQSLLHSTCLHTKHGSVKHLQFSTYVNLDASLMHMFPRIEQRSCPRSIQCRLIGFVSTSIYRLFDSHTGRIFTSRDVIFTPFYLNTSSISPIYKPNSRFLTSTIHIPRLLPLQHILPVQSTQPPQTTPPTTVEQLQHPIQPSPLPTNDPDSADDENQSPPPTPPWPRLIPTIQPLDIVNPLTLPPPESIPPPTTLTRPPTSTIPSTIEQQPVEPPNARPRKKIKPSLAARGATEATATRQASKKPEHSARMAIITTSSPEPTTYEEASPERDLWISTVQDELDSCTLHKTWHLVLRPQSATSLAPSGYSNQRQCSYSIHSMSCCTSSLKSLVKITTKTYTCVVKSTSVRALFAVAVQDELLIYQFDVKTAFLNGILQEELYIEFPLDSTSLGFLKHLDAYHLLKLHPLSKD
jgi:hypothetical protein